MEQTRARLTTVGMTNVRKDFAATLRSEPRDPTRDVGAEVIILFAELAAQRRLFIKKAKGKKTEPYDYSVTEQPGVAEEESLAEDHRQHSHVHGVAHVTIEPGHDQMLGRRDGRRRPQALDREAGERIEQDRQPGGDHQPAQHAERKKAERRRSQSPAGDRPGNVDSEGPGSDYQKDSRAEKCRGALHKVCPAFPL